MSRRSEFLSLIFSHCSCNIYIYLIFLRYIYRNAIEICFYCFFPNKVKTFFVAIVLKLNRGCCLWQFMSHLWIILAIFLLKTLHILFIAIPLVEFRIKSNSISNPIVSSDLFFNNYDSFKCFLIGILVLIGILKRLWGGIIFSRLFPQGDFIFSTCACDRPRFFRGDVCAAKTGAFQRLFRPWCEPFKFIQSWTGFCPWPLSPFPPAAPFWVRSPFCSFC